MFLLHIAFVHGHTRETLLEIGRLDRGPVRPGGQQRAGLIRNLLRLRDSGEDRREINARFVTVH
jgi:hypothetical protein